MDGAGSFARHPATRGRRRDRSMLADGRDAADAIADRTYSGKFVVRVPPELPPPARHRGRRPARLTQPFDQQPPRRLKRSSGPRPPGNAHCVSGWSASRREFGSEREKSGTGRAGGDDRGEGGVSGRRRGSESTGALRRGSGAWPTLSVGPGGLLRPPVGCSENWQRGVSDRSIRVSPASPALAPAMRRVKRTLGLHPSRRTVLLRATASGLGEMGSTATARRCQPRHPQRFTFVPELYVHWTQHEVLYRHRTYGGQVSAEGHIREHTND